MLARAPTPAVTAAARRHGAASTQSRVAPHAAGGVRCSRPLQLPPLQAQGDGPSTSSADPAPAVPSAAPAASSSSSGGGGGGEKLFYEGSASNAEVLISLLLALSLVYIPITIAVIGKRLWIRYRFTDKRASIINTSPFFAKQVDVAYSNIKEIRTAPRAFGLWGDCVIFCKDGSRLEITGLERYQDIKRHIMSCIYD